MKKIIYVSILALFFSNCFSQVPEKFSYQAIIRDNSGDIRSDIAVNLQIEIVQGSPTGNSIYIETHDVKTNSFGLVNLIIGAGAIDFGTFGSIDWAAGPYFIKVEVNGVVYGVTQILSVPFAIYAKKAENGFSGNYDDLINKPSPIREVIDEFNAISAQTSFTLTQTPSINSKVKMYINGIRISNKAYNIAGNKMTYVPSNNGSYVLTTGDRVQFDYSY